MPLPSMTFRCRGEFVKCGGGRPHSKKVDAFSRAELGGPGPGGLAEASDGVDFGSSGVRTDHHVDTHVSQSV